MSRLSYLTGATCATLATVYVYVSFEPTTTRAETLYVVAPLVSIFLLAKALWPNNRRLGAAEDRSGLPPMVPELMAPGSDDADTERRGETAANDSKLAE